MAPMFHPFSCFPPVDIFGGEEKIEHQDYSHSCQGTFFEDELDVEEDFEEPAAIVTDGVFSCTPVVLAGQMCASHCTNGDRGNNGYCSGVNTRGMPATLSLPDSMQDRLGTFSREELRIGKERWVLERARWLGVPVESVAPEPKNFEAEGTLIAVLDAKRARMETVWQGGEVITSRVRGGGKARSTISDGETDAGEESEAESESESELSSDEAEAVRKAVRQKSGVFGWMQTLDGEADSFVRPLALGDVVRYATEVWAIDEPYTRSHLRQV